MSMLSLCVYNDLYAQGSLTRAAAVCVNEPSICKITTQQQL